MNVSNAIIKRDAAISAARERCEAKHAKAMAEYRADLAAIEREYEADMRANLEQLLRAA